MSNITIIGAGNMAGAIAAVASKGGANVQVLARDVDNTEGLQGERVSVESFGDAVAGDIVVLAVPYPAVAEILDAYKGQLDGKTIVDITNPLDFATFDDLVVPSDSSAAAVIQAAVPAASVLKAFNTTFAATLATGTVGDTVTTVLIAGDSADAKAQLASVIEAGGLTAIDAGTLKRARELEAIGFAQLTLAVGEKISWTGGFAIVK